MSDKQKVPISQELAIAARKVLPHCGGGSCKSEDELAPGAIGHIITVQAVTRKKKKTRTEEGLEECIETTPIGLPILRWFVTFANPRSVWNFVHEMEQRFPEFGFFVQDRVKFPIMNRDDYPDLQEALIAEVARVGAVAVRQDRTALHASRIIVQISCGYPCNREGQTETPAVQDMLFAFPTVQSVKDFMTALKSIFDQKISLRVEIVQTPNLRPIEQSQGGGGGSATGRGGWKLPFGIWGHGNAQEAPFLAAG